MFGREIVKLAVPLYYRGFLLYTLIDGTILYATDLCEDRLQRAHRVSTVLCQVANAIHVVRASDRALL